MDHPLGKSSICHRTVPLLWAVSVNSGAAGITPEEDITVIAAALRYLPSGGGL